MAHLSERGLLKLRTMATGMEDTRNNDCVCESCVLGRQSAKPHNHHLPRGRHKMDVLHVDVAYSPIEAFDGCRYFVSIIDDYTQWAVTKPIQRRSDSSLAVQEFITANSTPECFTTLIIQDRGGENIGESHARWSRNRGITHYLSSTEQHQQNGTAEAYNKTIEHKTQSTLLSAPNLDARYWSPVIEHRITYIRNRSLCRRLTVTPYEAWTGDKPHLANIRIIGCKAYVHKLTAEMSKLVGTKAKIERLLGFKGNGHYLVTSDNPKRPQWRYDVDFNEPHPNCTNTTECESDGDVSESHNNGDDGAMASELGGEIDQATHQPKRVITATDESPNKQRRRTVDHESPNANQTGHGHDQESQSDSHEHDHESPHTGHEPTRTDHESRPTTPPGYASKTRPKTVGIDAPPSELIQQGKRKRKPKHHYWHHQNDASKFTNFNMLLFILMTASLATEPYEPTSYDDARHHSGRWSNWKPAMDDEHKSLRHNSVWKIIKRDAANGKILKGRWVFKLKRTGDTVKYKCR